MRLSILSVTAAAVICIAMQGPLFAADFIDHGIATRAVESRGVAVLEDSTGRSLVISLNNDREAQGWLLVTDIDTGETQQVLFPPDVDSSPALAAPFASFVSSRGRFYTGIGGVLMEFEPATGEWLYYGRPNPEATLFTDYAFGECPEGRIYFGTTFNCHLISYDPETQEAIDHGRMDPHEQFIRWVLCDDAGWVYCGIGTARGNIVAFNPKTGEKRQIPPEEERTSGSGWIFAAHDGKVYGTAAGKNWRMYEGVGEVIDASERGAVKETGVIGWVATTGTFPDGRKLTGFDMADGWMDIFDPHTDQTRRITFTYEATGGMGFTSLAAGPDGLVYGSTCHPMRFIRYNPQTGVVEDLGGVQDAGNFCAMTASGDMLAAVSYSSGILHIYDPSLPFDGGRGEAPNPRELVRWPTEICRPRAVAAHPDGRHLLMAGYAGYGLVGGGLGFYDFASGEASLLTHEELIPHHSTITLQVLPDGNLVGGTDIAAPGGGHVQRTEGKLYILHFTPCEVEFQTVPAAGSRFVKSLVVGDDGRVYGLADRGVFFVFDPQTREVVHREDLSEHGVERDLVKGPNGELYALLDNAVIRIEPQTLTFGQPSVPPSPITYGGPIIDGRLYYAARANLWSYGLQ